jgi:hypothetical protein
MVSICIPGSSEAGQHQGWTGRVWATRGPSAGGR